MKERRKVKIEVINNVAQFGDMTNEQLLADSERYDKENYNPLDNIEGKEILIPKIRP